MFKNMILNCNQYLFFFIYFLLIIIFLVVINSFLFNNLKKINNILVYFAPNEAFGALLRAVFTCMFLFCSLLLFISLKDYYLINFLFKNSGNSSILGGNTIGLINNSSSIFWNLICTFLFLIFFFCFEINYSYFLKLNKKKILNDIKNFSEYFLILLFFLFGSFIIIISTSLIYIYLGLELIALSIVILTASKIKAPLGSEGAIKYLVLASLSSAFFLLGSSVLYFIFGSLDLIEIFNLTLLKSFFNNKKLIPIFFIGSLFILISIFFKLGVAPFHNWVPDLYQSSSLSYVSVYSTVSKIVYTVLLIKLNYYLNFINNLILFEIYFKNLIIILSLLSLIIGSFGALIQLKIKRFLGYSAITHIGYILLPLVSTDSTQIIPSILFYLFNYTLIMIQIIAILIVVFSITGTFILNRLNSFKFSIFNTTMLWFCLLWSFAFLSLAGLPPFSGFWTKIQLLRSFTCDGNNIIFAIIVLLVSSLSIFYYLRFIVFSFFLPTLLKSRFKTHWILFKNNNSNMFIYYLIIILLFFNLFFGFFSDKIFNFLYNICFDEFFFKLKILF